MAGWRAAGVLSIMFVAAGLFVVVFVAKFADCRPAEMSAATYTTKYDNLNLDEILNNERLYKKYFHCLTGEGKCTPDGKELKDKLPEALATGCAKCTQRQRYGSDKVLKYMIEKRPEDWAKLEKIYDPEGTYKAKYKEEAVQHGIKLPYRMRTEDKEEKETAKKEASPEEGSR